MSWLAQLGVKVRHSSPNEDAEVSTDRLPAGVGRITAPLVDLADLYGLDVGSLGQLAALGARHPEIHGAVAVRVRDHVSRFHPHHGSRALFDDLTLDRMTRLSQIALGGCLDETLLEYAGSRMSYYDAAGAEPKWMFPWAIMIPELVSQTAKDSSYPSEMTAALVTTATRVCVLMTVLMTEVFIAGRDQQLVSHEQAMQVSGDLTAVASSLVHLASDDTGGLTTTVNEVHTALDRLGSDANDVNGIVDLIRTGADYTKLLAVNATIEAARAGAEGQGFKVVAQEVKQLAHTTDDYLHRIELSVERMRSHATAATTSIHDVETTTEQVRTAAEQLSQISIQLTTK